MPGIAPVSYTHSHQFLDGGALAFQCSQDMDAWPWLALPPFDPIVVQSINYWASVECGTARGTFDPNKWSALTQMDWEWGAESSGHAVHGSYEVIGDDANSHFHMRFFDADNALVYRMSGKGVVFQNRDFEGWRARAKAEIAERCSVGDFTYAHHEATGMPSQWQSFLSHINEGDRLSVQALMTRENSFMPNHIYHGGSGDHVNSNQLADVARQFAQALHGGTPIIITSGEMTFQRYVELERPFDIAVAENGLSDGKVAMNISQAGNFCSEVTLGFLMP